MLSTDPTASRRTPSPLVRLSQLLSTLCGIISAVMIVLSVLITCQMIFIRSVLNESTVWQTEAVVYLMIAATLLGLPYVQQLRGHVAVDLLPMLLPPGWRKALIALTLLASIVLMLLMLFYGFEQWYVAYERNWRSDTVWGVKLWIPYLALPVGFAVFLLQLLIDLYGVLSGTDDSLEPKGHG
jgi:TRAP-type C4-dicarboxylate transport system permease small subunit